MITDKPLISVIVPCFNERNTITKTLDSLTSQIASDGRPIKDWGEILVIDNGSTDGTRDCLKDYQQAHPYLHLIFNETNLGLAGSLNKAVKAASAPLLLSCQADCYPLRTNYVQSMIAHFADPMVAGITGKPSIPDYKKLTFAEKTYILLNLMDIEPEPQTVREINFTEGRCDGFRKCALLEVGLFNEETRTSGEDQIMSIELRKRGYRILQDTALEYALGFGSSQNTFTRIIKHTIPLAQGQAIIFARSGFGTSQLAATSKNRSRRKRLRFLQITATPIGLLAILICAFHSSSNLAICVLTVVILRFFYLAAENRGRLSVIELLRVLPAAFACDVAYCFGFYRGLYRSWREKLQ